LIWYSGNTPSSRSYFGKNFSGCLGYGCVGPRMEIESIVSQGFYATMVLEKLQIIQEYEIKVIRVFILENAE
jgi:hypothetical protein